MYAALDAWVALEICSVLKNAPSVGMPLQSAAPVGQPISVHLGKKEVAQGIIVFQPREFPIAVGSSSDNPPVMLRVASTKTRAVVRIDNVLAPKCLLSYHKKTLEELQNGQTAFDVVVNLSSLRTRSINPPSIISPHIPPQEPGNPVLIEPSANTQVEAADLNLGGNYSEDFNPESDSDSEDGGDVGSENTVYVQSSVNEDNPSGILIDVFHEMHKLTRTIPKGHSLHKQFSTAFSKTMLIPDEGDKHRMVEYLQKKGTTFDKQYIAQNDWLWKRVRRYVPEPNVLYPIVKEFFDCWGAIICTGKKIPLFTPDSWNKSQSILHDIQKGWVSDPKGISMYVLEWVDKHGFNIYRCLRGTSDVEGAVHTHIRKNFASLNASPPLADCILADWRHRHNVEMDALHKKGTAYYGHYDPWIDHEITKLQADINWTETSSGRQSFHYSDPLNFQQTQEQFGITQIPDAIRIQCNFDGLPVMDPLTVSEDTSLSLIHVYPTKLQLSTLSGKRTDIYNYLSAAQKTKYAVTPIHTKEEYILFNNSVSIGGQWFSSTGVPNFAAMAGWWSSQANGVTIFYKMQEHLEKHYKSWLEHKKEKENLVNSQQLRAANEKRITAPTHIAKVLEPAALMQTPRAPEVSVVHQSSQPLQVQFSHSDTSAAHCPEIDHVENEPLDIEMLDPPVFTQVVQVGAFIIV